MRPPSGSRPRRRRVWGSKRTGSGGSSTGPRPAPVDHAGDADHRQPRDRQHAAGPLAAQRQPARDGEPRRARPRPPPEVPRRGGEPEGDRQDERAVLLEEVRRRQQRAVGRQPRPDRDPRDGAPHARRQPGERRRPERADQRAAPPARHRDPLEVRHLRLARREAAAGVAGLEQQDRLGGAERELGVVEVVLARGDLRRLARLVGVVAEVEPVAAREQRQGEQERRRADARRRERRPRRRFSQQVGGSARHDGSCPHS